MTQTIPHILYIEDDEAQIELTQYGLEDSQYNFTVEFARTGEKGISLFDPEKYDLVLTDWNLPDMQAPEIAQAILTKYAAASIVFLSNSYMEQHFTQANALNAKACLTKGDIKENLNEVAEILRGQYSK